MATVSRAQSRPCLILEAGFLNWKGCLRTLRSGFEAWPRSMVVYGSGTWDEICLVTCYLNDVS